MKGGHRSYLSDILKLLNKLGKDIGLEHTAPTKQGGSGD